jgi:hypothetical protein
MNAAYVRTQLEVALRFARFEKDAVRDFDQSFDGFFRSFIGILLCVPFYVLIVLADRSIAANAPLDMPGVDMPPLPPASLTFFALESLNYLVNWIAFPLAMIFITRLIGAGGRYVPFIVAYNWTSCVVFALTIIPPVLYLSGLMPVALASSFSIPIILLAITYRFKVAREALDVSTLNAAGIVLFDLLLSLLIVMVNTQLRAGLVGA